MLLKDIKSEQPNITEKDNLRLLYVTKWFLEFLHCKEQGQNNGKEKWSFSLIAEVAERSWIIWVLKRMREAVEEKVPLLWGIFASSAILPSRWLNELMIDDLA